MKEKKIPQRKCVGCREMKPKKDLVRVVRAKDGTVSLDTSGKASGRGAYVCSCLECFEKAKKSGQIARSLSCEIPPIVYEKLEEAIGKNE